jgi:AcrR family transcriptional regulator
MPMPRPKVDHDERRARVAKAACEVILDVGLENAKLADIGARAGVTTGAVQHYFRSKEDLLFFAKNHVFDLTMEKAAAAPPELVGAERLYFIIRQHLPLTSEHVKAIRLLEAFRGRAIGNATLLRNQHKRDRKFLSMLEQELARLKVEGLVHADLDVPSAALGLNGIIEGIGCIVMASPTAYKDFDLFGLVADYVSNVFGTPPAAGHAPAPRRAVRAKT